LHVPAAQTFQEETEAHLQYEAEQFQEQGLCPIEAITAARRTTRFDPIAALRYE
jgi:hypothetical protein